MVGVRVRVRGHFQRMGMSCDGSVGVNSAEQWWQST